MKSLNDLISDEIDKEISKLILQQQDLQNFYANVHPLLERISVEMKMETQDVFKYAGQTAWINNQTVQEVLLILDTFYRRIKDDNKNK